MAALSLTSTQVLTASHLNTNMASPVRWDSTWTPTVTQSSSVSYHLVYARYGLFGPACAADCKLVITGTGTASNIIRISLPKTPSTNQDGTICPGSGIHYDRLGQIMTTCVTFPTTSGLQLLSTAASQSGYIGTSGVTGALAPGDQLSFSIFYEWTA